MEIFFRNMKYEDAEQVMHLSKQLGYDISLLQTKSNIEALHEQKDNEAFVAVHDNKVIGWINVVVVITIASSPICEIHGLVVDEQYRNNNIGKMLIERAKQWCKEKNHPRLRVRCNVKRKDTHTFYRHLGFTEKKQQTVFEITI